MRLLFLFIMLFSTSPVHAAPPPLLYGLEIPADKMKKIKPIFMEAEKKNWTNTLKMAEKQDQLTLSAVKWFYLSSDETQPFFVEFETFLLAHKGWPEQDKLIRRAEAALAREADKLAPAAMLKWFNQFKPISKKGRMLLLTLSTDSAEKNQLIQTLWSEHDMDRAETDQFLKNYQTHILPASHAIKARRLMDKGNIPELNLTYRFLNADQRKLYTIRQQLAKAPPQQIAALIKAVPRTMVSDPGYLMQLLRLFHKNEMHDEAQIILLEYKPLPEYQEDWENIRRVQAREVMKSKRYRAAHDIAMRHSFTDGEKASEMEWFAGWIQLEYINDPAKAFKHFNNVLGIVKTNMSLSRAYYWLARTYERQNDKKHALEYFNRAAQYGWTFYGQLAASHIKIKPNMTPIKTQQIPESKATFLRVAHMFASIDEIKIARLFLSTANKTLETGGQHLTLSYFAKRLGIQENVVRFAREAQNKQPGIALEAYPKLDLVFQAPLVKKGLDPAIVHAIILQESRFDEKVIAFDGGMGYMQFMDATAKRIAKLAKVPYSHKKLLQGKYNILLGTTYLEELLRIHDGCFPFIIPAYNAGDTPVNRWRQEFGDPLKGETDIINWAESITFVVTRSYIQRVLENLYVYRHLFKIQAPNCQPWWKGWNVARSG